MYTYDVYIIHSYC